MTKSQRKSELRLGERCLSDLGRIYRPTPRIVANAESNH
jgi:hypothetical protein